MRFGQKRLIRLWFYDESGFNLNPNALYAWLLPQKEAKNTRLKTILTSAERRQLEVAQRANEQANPTVTDARQAAILNTVNNSDGLKVSTVSGQINHQLGKQGSDEDEVVISLR